MNQMLQDFFNGITEGLFGIVSPRHPSCVDLGEDILKESYETFLDLVRFSEVDFDALTTDDRRNFELKFINTSIFSTSLKKRPPLYLTNQSAMIPFCEVVPVNMLPQMFKQRSVNCKYFKPTVTFKGFCQSINELPLNEIFKPTTVVPLWSSVFNLSQRNHVMNPTGYGSLHGLNFLLNAYDPANVRTTRNFILSITNRDNSFDIFRQQYQIKPGFVYTFKIVASEISVTERFQDLDKSLRGCSLPSENSQSNLTNFYSQSNCEYECAINYAKEKVKCLPWSIPRLTDDQTKFCDYEKQAVFFQELEAAPLSTCNCDTDCSGMSYSVFDSRRPLEESEVASCDSYAVFARRRDYPNFVFCNLCRRIVRNYKIRLYYNFVVSKHPNFNFLETFCSKFLLENVALVKVEMATKAITRSVKDKRYNFVAQLSSLGTAALILSVLLIN